MCLRGMLGATFLIIWSLLFAQVVLANVVPPAYPLVVKSPYLSSWMAMGNNKALNGAWPTFWTGSVSIILFNFKNDMISSCL